jgi:hypothetical protein
LVKDPTSPNTLSGSLLWDSTNDYWKGGTLGNESKILLAGGDGVLSGSTDFSAFSTSVDSRLSNLQTKSASVDISITNINSTTASLNTSISNLNGATASLYTSASLMTASITSLNVSVVELQQFSGNVNTRFDNLQTYTTSVDSRFTTLGSYTASVNQTTTSLNLFTESTNTRLGLLETSTGSLNLFTGSTLTRLNLLETSTGSLNLFTGSTLTRLNLLETSTGSLNLFTASAYVSFSLMTSSIDELEDRVNYFYGINGLGGGNPLLPLNQFSASAKISIQNLEVATGSYATTGSNVFTGTQYINTINTNTDNGPTIPSIGDNFQAGKVAYILQPGDTGYDTNYTKGLIISNTSVPITTWGCSGTLISGTSDAIGTGQTNSNLIIAGGCSVAGTAINFVDTLTTASFSDWYLPSYNELQQIYNNRASLGIATNITYWSSTDYDTTYVKALNFAFGTFTLAQKNITAAAAVAVRSFSIYNSTKLTINGYVVLSQVSASLNFANDEAAANGGVPLGGLYRNGNFILIRLT